MVVRTIKGGGGSKNLHLNERLQTEYIVLKDFNCIVKLFSLSTATNYYEEDDNDNDHIQEMALLGDIATNKKCKSIH